MKINLPMLDFITATTNKFKAYQHAVWQIVPDDESGRRGQFLQYRGDRYEGIFHGQAQQGDKTNYLVQVTGSQANTYAYDLIKNGMKVTRLDLQITIHMPSWYSAREFADSLSYGVWPMQRRQVALIESETGHTVYVGSRSSDKYVRFYTKDGRFLRYELELKSERAVAAAKIIVSGQESAIAAILGAELDKMPQAAIIDSFHDVLTVDPKSVRVEWEDSQDVSKLKWLAKMLPAIERLMNDHQHGDMVAEWFIDMVQRKIDRK